MAQDRLAEASRIALKYNFIKLCEGCCMALGRAKQSSLRGKIWSEYSKAELDMNRPREEIDKKTKMAILQNYLIIQPFCCKQNHSEWFGVKCTFLEKCTESNLFIIIVLGRST